MTSKGKLAEQIIRLYKGGDIGTETELDEREVFLLIGQVYNQLLKAERYNNLNEGDRQASNSIIASYDNVLVKPWKSKSKIDLPAVPLSLPRNMGVWYVAPMDDPFEPFIPLQAGQYSMIKNHVVGLLENKTGYEVHGRELVFTKDLEKEGIEKVFLQLILLDIEDYGETDPLPLPPEIEGTVISQVLALLQPSPPSDKTVDNRDQP